jgi:hypothetical protein
MLVTQYAWEKGKRFATMQQVNIEEAKMNLSDLVEAAMSGVEAIDMRGEPC